jgi:glutamate decarboxylase
MLLSTIYYLASLKVILICEKVGVASELILSVLNTNLHVFAVSPALTIIEKTTSKNLASLFGFDGPHSGGISQQGGSASNATSLVIARNALFPSTKTEGNGDKKFVLFTSAHGHYSLEKAAVMCGLGSKAVRSVAVDAQGRIVPSELRNEIQKARDDGLTPFYVNATAGTTVLGSFDPFGPIADICEKEELWMHVDGSWGGSAVFSSKYKEKLNGVERADSIAVNPHKMMGVPLTCSFLLGKDMRRFHSATTLKAAYLFHEGGEDKDASEDGSKGGDEEVWDLADLTLQCGRRGDSLKLALGWIYNGRAGYERLIDHAFDTAAYFAEQLSSNANFVLVSENPPPCLQVCFYYAPAGEMSEDKNSNSGITRKVTGELVRKGFMIDYAPGDKGSFFRAVVNIGTEKGTVDGLIKAIEDCGGVA